jgi:deazaflavin-dependent oxidoreductase (nitroreductase family)
MTTPTLPTTDAVNASTPTPRPAPSGQRPAPAGQRPAPAAPTSRVRAVARRFGPIGRRMAGSRAFPFWAILRHTGRVSGATYEIPVVARPAPGGYLIPLPFGEGTQWARNLLAAGGGSVRVAGREHVVVDPEVVELETVGPLLNPVIRLVAARLGIHKFVRVRIGDQGSPRAVGA